MRFGKIGWRRIKSKAKTLMDYRIEVSTDVLESEISIISAPGHFLTLGLQGIMGHAFAKLLWITNDSGSSKSEKKDTMLIYGNGGIILLIGVGGFKFKALNLVDVSPDNSDTPSHYGIWFQKSVSADFGIRDADDFDLLFSYILLA